jgi:acetolactate decarboxylase
MKSFCALFLILSLGVWGIAHGQTDVLTQVSTIDALMTGVYDGEKTLGWLREKGDFGHGTFNTLDGEMVVLDGQVYRVTAAGTVERPPMETKTPFASVTFFEPDRNLPLEPGIDFQRFVQKVGSLLPSPNIFYAMKITGTFRTVKARSVPAQKKPYRPLSEVVKTQPVFELKNVQGTIVGFWCPPYVKGINVPGYHLHFLTADRKAGGHVLDFNVEKAILEIDDTRELSLVLPSDSAFDQADLTVDREKELKAVEK